MKMGVATLEVTMEEYLEAKIEEQSAGSSSEDER